MNMETHSSNFMTASESEMFAGQSPELPLYKGQQEGISSSTKARKRQKKKKGCKDFEVNACFHAAQQGCDPQLSSVSATMIQ